MKTNQKQEYSSPRMEIISIQNESLLGGASNTVEESNGLKKNDYTTPSTGEHNGGEAEWQKISSHKEKDVSNKSFDTSFFYVVMFALLRIEVLLNVFVETGEYLLY